jgi:hypothetical protein
LQVVACPPGHNTGAPAQHSTMSQSCVPAGAFGHSTTQLAPLAHSLWQGPLSHTNSHAESTPQAQVPLAQVPSQRSFSPSQRTWQGGAPHSKAQLAPCSQPHMPLAQVASQREPSPHATLQGGASQVSSQSAPFAQRQARFEQSRRRSRSQPGATAHSQSNEISGNFRHGIEGIVAANRRFGSSLWPAHR